MRVLLCVRVCVCTFTCALIALFFSNTSFSLLFFSLSFLQGQETFEEVQGNSHRARRLRRKQQKRQQEESGQAEGDSAGSDATAKEEHATGMFASAAESTKNMLSSASGALSSAIERAKDVVRAHACMHAFEFYSFLSHKHRISLSESVNMCVCPTFSLVDFKCSFSLTPTLSSHHHFRFTT